MLTSAANKSIDVSVVTGSLNRLPLLRKTLQSVRSNGFSGSLEIIVVDGGSKDGTLEWLARQNDVLTILQPNYTRSHNGVRRKAHSWGEFINLGFRNSRGRWILMISDDVLLSPGCIDSGFRQLEAHDPAVGSAGAGAFFYRDYPRSRTYHLKYLPNKTLLVNHGFFCRSALEKIGYADETSYEFYAADGDLCMRLAQAGFSILPLHGCFVDHLAHAPKLRRLFDRSQAHSTDIRAFEQKWGVLPSGPTATISSSSGVGTNAGRAFWRVRPLQCALATVASLLDSSSAGPGVK